MLSITMYPEVESIVPILESVAEKLKIDKWTYVRRNSGNNAMNFIGNLTSVYLIEEQTGKENGLIIKQAPWIPHFQNTIDLVYKKEVYVYSTLLPIFESLKTDVNLEELYPECYFADSRRDPVLVLKDVSLNGFERYKQGEFLDFQHMVLSLTSAARFHSLSFVIFEKKIEVPLRDILRPFLDDYPKDYAILMRHNIKSYLPLFKNKYYEGFLRKLYEHFMENFNDSALKAKKWVYGHGDLWKENILFKYSKEIPTAACLVDYQLTRLLSPAQDVLFLIMSGTDSITRRNHYKRFLSTYYSTLRDTLLRNGVDAATVYSEEDFNIDLRVVFPFCFTLIVRSFLLWLGLEDIDSLVLKKKKQLCKKDRELLETKLIGIVDDLIFDFVRLGYIKI